jgi:hypothetical protein
MRDRTARLLGDVRHGSAEDRISLLCLGQKAQELFDTVPLSALQHPLSGPSNFWKSCDFYIATHNSRPQMDLP